MLGWAHSTRVKVELVPSFASTSYLSTSNGERQQPHTNSNKHNESNTRPTIPPVPTDTADDGSCWKGEEELDYMVVDVYYQMLFMFL